jgi:hypothetical protein
MYLLFWTFGLLDFWTVSSKSAPCPYATKSPRCGTPDGVLGLCSTSFSIDIDALRATFEIMNYELPAAAALIVLQLIL